MLLRRGPGVLQRLLTPPGVHSAFTEHMIKERGLDGSLDSLGVRVVLHPVHKRHMRRFAKAQVDDGFYIEMVFIPAHPPRAGLVGSVERAWKLVAVRGIGAQETVVDEPVVEPVFEGGGKGRYGGINALAMRLLVNLAVLASPHEAPRTEIQKESYSCACCCARGVAHSRLWLRSQRGRDLKQRCRFSSGPSTRLRHVSAEGRIDAKTLRLPSSGR